ncbi:hypothetical protein [endosymbiont of Ridgeia piscesae]|jgi:hypothetical protein|uniref:Lipoprotein n=1 Tax=endosymbiont of Ridgeia piscesae TaxID=54398 RepID=A0A0T5Z1G4_9GAMM|nr:hypothetical protein [endosymbiont of Ridgeia piscesae]KRT53686.1 hypothetical protein Ga0074115_10117 [endosymbiont of Ridgeia piscesae]KRT56690.1 hypothetical protein Ga0076813_10072 [endosymbiont of Ridgeia piscesae]
MQRVKLVSLLLLLLGMQGCAAVVVTGVVVGAAVEVAEIPFEVGGAVIDMATDDDDDD